MVKHPRNKSSGRNDSKLFDVYQGCEASLKRFLHRFSSRPEDIDEMAQETFLRAFDIEINQEIKSPKAYLFRVARNIALRELSKKSRQLTDYLEESVDESILGRADSSEEELIAQQKTTAMLQRHCRTARTMQARFSTQKSTSLFPQRNRRRARYIRPHSRKTHSQRSRPLYRIPEPARTYHARVKYRWLNHYAPLELT